METPEKVIEIVADEANLKVEAVRTSDTLGDLGFDSLDNVQLVMRIENEFGIKVSDDELEHIVTVADIVKLVLAKK